MRILILTLVKLTHGLRNNNSVLNINEGYKYVQRLLNVLQKMLLLYSKNV